MHTGIVLVVEAEDAESAVAEVEHFNEHNAQWSDWNEHGGRWSEVVPNAVLQYSENPALFEATVDKFRGFTMDEQVRLLSDIGDVTVKELVTDPKYRFGRNEPVKNMTPEERDRYFDETLAVYRAKQLLKIVDGDFSQMSHFYDVQAYSSNEKYLLERIEREPNKQFLVVWDYHH
jgi:hypothetical protein